MRDPNELFCVRACANAQCTDSDQDRNNWMRMDGEELECCFQ